LYSRGPQIGFGPPATPDVIKALIAANAVVYVLQTFWPALTLQLAVRPSAVFESGAVWQLGTYMWLHASPLHLIFNMLSLWMFGSQVAMAWGAQRFLRFYLICGVGAGAVIAAWPGLLELFGVATTSYLRPTVGASGAVYGVLLAFSLLWPDRTIMMLFPPIPLKAIWFIPFLVFMELIWWNPGVSTLGHLGGVATGYVALRAMGLGGRASFGQIKWRLKRWRMRRQLRAVRMDELRERQRERDRRTFH
jgi:membrane associated rhomboid family serine protease